MSPDKTGIHGNVADAIRDSFGDFDKFREAFTQAVAGHFGYGWAWLVSDQNGSVRVLSTHDAGNPLRSGLMPLMTCDVWEHAFYIDYRNDKAGYVKNFRELINRDFVEHNYKS